jgi:hypothetical protein
MIAGSLPALWKTYPPLREAKALPALDNKASKKDIDALEIFTEWDKSDIFSQGKRSH